MSFEKADGPIPNPYTNKTDNDHEVDVMGDGSFALIQDD